LYSIFIKTHFDAAHQLHGYPGECCELHGHTWKIGVKVTAEETDKIGISFDFKKLKSITESVISAFDHKHINQVKPFDTVNPTAENLSQYIYQKIAEQLPRQVKMSEVTLWESDNYALTYREE
jgi:6-pyruvoyltetrahydropterin/6-carboxytetrahydropterin synthase